MISICIYTEDCHAENSQSPRGKFPMENPYSADLENPPWNFFIYIFSCLQLSLGKFFSNKFSCLQHSIQFNSIQSKTIGKS